MATELNSSNFNEAISGTTAPVIVDFWAPWCGPCRSQAPILDKLQEELGNNVKVFKVNVDEENPLSKKFGVMSIPTLIVFKNGEIINKAVGLQSMDALKMLIGGHKV